MLFAMILNLVNELLGCVSFTHRCVFGRIASASVH
jgi:hypothetical protein